jgi:cytidylate kinase
VNTSTNVDTDLFVTVSGAPGSGVTTLCEGLAEAMGCGYVSGGEVFRRIADDRGVSLRELTAAASASGEIDRELDRRLQQIAREWGAADKAFVLESRLAGWLAGDDADLRIWLDAPEEVRVERTRDREELAAEMRVREVVDESRYASQYGIDLSDRSIYDLVVNTARWSPEGTLRVVAAAVDGYDPAADEGTAPTPTVDV